MLTVRLVGGLGNQLFQYAYGRTLMRQHEVQFMNHCGQYGCSVDRFNTQVVYNEKPEGPARSEKGLTYDPSELVVQDPSVLYGYWQCEKYFLDVENALRLEFTLKEAPSDYAKGIAEQVEREQSVSLHIRRGDYLTWAREIHGLLPLDYYVRAANYLLERKKDLRFYVFSDDPEWASHNFNFPYAKVVAHSSPHEDLWVMSKCKHSIVANSSFSWWGAWLGDRKDKITIAPQQWFAQGNENSKDIVPERWLRL